MEGNGLPEPKKRPVILIVVLAVLVIALVSVGGYFIFKSKTKNKLESLHSWPMFHGNYNHTGYANVSGPASNKLKWKYLIGAIQGNWPNSVIVAQDGTVFIAGGNKITALNANGSLKWTQDFPSAQGPGLSADEKTLYIAAGSSLIAASAVDGSKKWEFKAGGNMVFGPTIGPDGTIYQGSWDKYFYAINPDGTEKWKYLTKGTISYPSSIDKNGHIYLGGGDAHFGPDGNLYAFDQDGKLLWTYDTKMLRVGSPAIGADGLLYVPASPVLMVINTEGKLVWKKGPDLTATPTGASDPIPSGTSTAPCAPPPAPCGNATGAAPGSGETPETRVAPGSAPGIINAGEEVIAGIITPALTPDGTIYIGNPQGKFMALDAQTQEIKWSYQTGKNPEPGIDYGLPSFVVADKDGTVYFGALDHKFYALDKDGKVKWNYETGGKITEASPAIGTDGTIYFTSEDGYIYAVGK